MLFALVRRRVVVKELKPSAMHHSGFVCCMNTEFTYTLGNFYNGTKMFFYIFFTFFYVTILYPTTHRHYHDKAPATTHKLLNFGKELYTEWSMNMFQFCECPFPVKLSFSFLYCPFGSRLSCTTKVTMRI